MTDLTQPQIYDTVATHYASVLDVPGSKIVYWMIDQFLQDNFSNSLESRHVLELACGTGDLLRKCVGLKCSTAIGIDVSGEMIKIARSIDASMGLGDKGIEYHISDCTQPITALEGRGLEGKFDLVLGNWLFNYAQSSEDIIGMWRNVARYLKPGGRFVGAFTGNPEAVGLKTGKYGAIGTVTGKIGKGKEEGTRVHIMFATAPPVEFDVFILNGHLYQEGAKLAGLSQLKIAGPQLECLPESENREYWQDEI